MVKQVQSAELEKLLEFKFGPEPGKRIWQKLWRAFHPRYGQLSQLELRLLRWLIQEHPGVPQASESAKSHRPSNDSWKPGESAKVASVERKEEPGPTIGSEEDSVKLRRSAGSFHGIDIGQ